MAMPKKNDNNLLVGLDVGTAKVVAIVAEKLPNGVLDVVGVGSYPSNGLKKGAIVNVDSTVVAIQAAIAAAELMAGCQVRSVYTGISGRHINSFNSHVVGSIKNTEVTQADIDKILNTAKGNSMLVGQEILHVIPQEYIIDGQAGIKNPIGMFGSTLEVKVHIVTVASSAVQNIINCVRKCNLEIDDIILQSLAASYAVLSEDEKQLGVCLIDIGAGTTDVALYLDGALQHSFVLPVAGNQITNDLAVVLKQATQNAEIIKVQHACTYLPMVDPEYTINLGVGYDKKQVISQQYLADIVVPRYTELFELIDQELKRAGFTQMPAAGIVLVGDSCLMPGVLQLAANILQSAVRLGIPQYTNCVQELEEKSCYTNGLGLLLYASKTQQPKVVAKFAPLAAGVLGILERVKHWFQGNF
jgi:cell division protein FtsA